MKKLFTLILALVGMTAAVNAATIDDVQQCKHSYVLKCDDVTNNGTVKPAKGSLFGDDFFLAVTGNSVATNKQKSNPSDAAKWGDTFANKYADCTEGFNSLRLKNAQDVIAMKVTMGSKIIILGQVHASRYPKIATNAALTENVKTASSNTVATDGKFEWVADDDLTIYIGSQGGDYFIGYIIVEANEPAGTPSVKVGPQTFEGGLFYRTVTCTPSFFEEMGANTVVTYTTDGSIPTADSPVYTEPIKCYAEQTIKFQAYADIMGDGTPMEDFKCEGAENEAIVSFNFNAPTIEFDEATKTVKVVSEYAALGAEVAYTSEFAGNVIEDAEFQMDASATVTSGVIITNGTYGTFESKTTSKDVYVLDALTEKTVVAVTTGSAVVDEEATATSTTGTVYKIEGGAISADPTQFFVKNLEFAALPNATMAEYQVPAGQEAYIKMNTTNITFRIADCAMVIVECSKNACKNVDSETATDRQCKVTVNGVTYGNDDILVENGNIINFDIVEPGYYTFQKFSGTGNILISSITILPGQTAVAGVKEAAESAEVVKVVKDGQLVIVKNGAEFNAAGAQIK